MRCLGDVAFMQHTGNMLFWGERKYGEGWYESQPVQRNHLQTLPPEGSTTVALAVWSG